MYSRKCRTHHATTPTPDEFERVVARQPHGCHRGVVVESLAPVGDAEAKASRGGVVRRLGLNFDPQVLRRVRGPRVQGERQTAGRRDEDLDRRRSHLREYNALKSK